MNTDGTTNDQDAFMIQIVDEALSVSKVGTEIPNDENNIVLAARSSDHSDLPLGNYNYEEMIDTVIEEEAVVKVTATHVHKVLQNMGVTKNNKGGFTSSVTFWQISNSKPGKDWREQFFLPSIEYPVLVSKTKRTMETRLKSLTGDGDSPHGSNRTEPSPPENKRKRTALDDVGRKFPQPEDFESLLASVRSCVEIDQFIAMYESGLVYDCLNRIRSAFRESGKSVEEWTREWAMRLYEDDEGAKNLHRDRKLSLELLYTLYNRWKGKKCPQTLTAENIVNDFEKRRIMEILKLCLPMDRACALYTHTVAGESQPGTHWVSEIHLDRDPEWAERMKNYDGSPTMNKRFLWLMEDEELAGLGLRDSNFMRTYTTPTMASTSDQV